VLDRIDIRLDASRSAGPAADDGRPEMGSDHVQDFAFNSSIRSHAARLVRVANVGVHGPSGAGLVDELVSAIMNADTTRRWPNATGREDELYDMWWYMCYAPHRTSHSNPTIVTECVMRAFLLAGLALRPPFHVSSMFVRRSPLCTAIMCGSPLADALLDLPMEAGLDVDAPGGGLHDCAPPIGHTNSIRPISPRIFERLLDRTNPAIVSAGLVFVDTGIGQSVYPTTHVLIANILGSSMVHEASNSFAQLARMFIARAQPDGGGADLTGGIAQSERQSPENPTTNRQPAGESRDTPTTNRPPASVELWPNAKFGGALALVHVLIDWYTNGLGHDCASSARVQIDRLLHIARELTAALCRVRDYRRTLESLSGQLLGAGGVHAHPLRSLIAAYVLVPLRNEPQLADPLLNHCFTTSQTPSDAS
jgi:hypothetical protein